MFKDTYDGLEEPPHPGEILREDILPCLDLTTADLARHLAINESDLSEFLNEKRPVSIELAQRLALALGQTPRYWLSLQVQFDMFQAASQAPAGVKPVTWRPRNAAIL
jgi:antitoxin HigA-1